MKTKNIINTLFIVLFLFIAGCATMGPAGHKYIMRGQILEVTGDTAYLCIGSKDGAKVGQEYTVYKFERAPNPNPNVKGSWVPYFKKEATGKVKIMEIVDEHMANAKIVTGAARVNDVVELNP